MRLKEKNLVLVSKVETGFLSCPDPRHSLAGSSPGSVSIQPLRLDDSKLDLPHVKSKLFGNDQR